MNNAKIFLSYILSLAAKLFFFIFTLAKQKEYNKKKQALEKILRAKQ